MPGRSTRAAQALLLAAVASLVAADAGAARCGGDKPCACGDKVVRDYRLPANLGPCPEDGLRLEVGVSLDGGGHAIRGSGAKGVGLRIASEASGAQVSNLVISGFADGVRLIGSRNVRLSGIEAHGNGDPGEREGYGIDVSAAASDNVLERLRVHGNVDEGIHVGTGASRNRIVDSQIFGNGRENVYFLSCSENRLERSDVRDPGAGHASVYVKFATGTVLDGNTVAGGPVQIRGASSGTVLEGNSLRAASVVLEEQDDARFGRGKPSQTTVRGGSIDAPDACVRIEAATGTTIEDVKLTCPGGISVARGSRVGVRGLSASGAKSPVRCAGGGAGCVDSTEPPLGGG